ncbi:MAG: discoidin domain-containing protein [Anaerolinea sp.]|nr:discoidin domain-containing protein [Anaerolinea sp.]
MDREKHLESFGILVGLLALIIAVLNWLIPFNPIGPSPMIPKTRLVEVASGKQTTSSAFWQYRDGYSFSSQAIVDRKTVELHCDNGVQSGNSYWLLPDKTSGWVEIDLGHEYQIAKFRYLNTHNGNCADRATKNFHIAISSTGKFKGEEMVVIESEMPFSLSPTFQEVNLLNPISGRHVRFYVHDYYGWGGGLNELEVYALEILP